MKEFTKLSRQALLEEEANLEKEYAAYQAKKLNLDMSRGKPAEKQLDLSNGVFTALQNYKTEAGADARNYGILDGVPEVKRFFSELLAIPADQIIIGGNASLNLMYDSMARFMLFGSCGSTPWCRLPKVKFLCPAPGYDRHFGICEDLGIEMIAVPMKEDGPDMDVVEKLAASDDSIKGIWCVPLYSNPQGICYSDKVVDRLASMKTAATDFRIMWDNAYGVHHIFGETSLKDIFKACAAAGNPDRPFYFFSTSKITFPGAGVALMASSIANIEEVKKHMTKQTIGHDKLNQLRTIAFLKSPEGLRQHMRALADELRPKFEVVVNTLQRELGGSGLLSWTNPKGGYFVAVDTLEGCAKATVELAKNAGVKLTGAGATYPYKKDPRDTNIRIAPSYPTVEELTEAMNLFCVCVKLTGVRRLLGK